MSNEESNPRPIQPHSAKPAEISNSDFENLSPELVGELHSLGDRGHMIAQLIHSSHKGPLPPADEFAKYETACPGTAKVIV